MRVPGFGGTRAVFYRVEGVCRMHLENDILHEVEAAKESDRAADRLIQAYLPFIKAETAKFLRRPPIEGQDDELSIALMAFHEAIHGYSRLRGAFLRYAAMLIRSRLIDYSRREKKHSGVLSIDAKDREEEQPLAETLSSPEDFAESGALREATRQEIEELRQQMEDFGVSLGDVADNCPKQRRTLDACRKALSYAHDHSELMEEFLRTKRLPLTALSEGSGAERKTLERHRKYLVALLLIHTNGYEIIRGHIKQVLKGGEAQ